MRSASTHSATGPSTTAWSPMDGRPAQQGMYDPRNEKDACGVGFVANLTGEATHTLVEQALTVLRNLEHRGATGSEPDSGDGAGILSQVPDAFLREVAGFELPEAGGYAVGIAFLPADGTAQAVAVERIEAIAAEENLTVLGWREVPVTPDLLGNGARATMPAFSQLFVSNGSTGIELDRKAFVLRKRAEREAGVYFPSLSARTIVYKGMLTTGQLEPFFPDLSDRRFASAVALVHSRFSTNTFPSWPLAHPYRFVAHNGEINTVKGNRNWMKARESQLVTAAFGEGALDRIFPICTPDASDSASFDEVLELLHLGGRSLPHSVLMMIPEAWENHTSMDPARRAFYKYHSTQMEPWDGPACVTFTDGTQVGAVLDRNGLRPGRYWVTDDGLVVLGSEVGVLDIDPAKVVRKGRLQPGKMFLVDTAQKRIIEDDEIKNELAAAAPTRNGWRPARSSCRTCPSVSTSCTPTPRSPAASRPSATPRKSCASSSRRWPVPPASRSAPWVRTPRSRPCPSAPGCSSTTSPSSSRRSPTRRWTPSARSSSPRCCPRSAPRATCWSRTPRPAAASPCPSR